MEGYIVKGFYYIKSEVIEGGILFPVLFILYVNDLIKCLKEEGVGHCISVNYCECLFFADDILLISASVLQLQCMLIICYDYCKAWDLKFNVSKSNLMVVGRRERETMPSMIL